MLVAHPGRPPQAGLRMSFGGERATQHLQSELSRLQAAELLVPDDEQGLLVEWPTGQIERIMVWAFAVVMVKSDLEHTRFDELEVRIWAKDEDFFWQLVLECTQVMGLGVLQPECSDPRCPVHGTHPTLPHGPFESWDLAYQNARESCSIPDDGREDPNC